jgi:hypothetical protein
MADFAMFTAAGNAAVAELFDKACKLPMTASDDAIYAMLNKGLDRIEKKHVEVWDTDVRKTLIGQIEVATGRTLTIYF